VTVPGSGGSAGTDGTDGTAGFGRVLTAMVTPFTRDGGLDLATAATLAAALVDDGHDGLVVNGTTGESPTTTDEEKAALVRAVVEAVDGRAAVVAGVGTNDTAHTLTLARAAQAAGATGLLVVTPYYSKPPQAGLLAHFTTVADATELPVMLYDIPGRSGVPIETETLVRLADHPRIRAVKDAKGDLAATAWVLARTDLAYYSGDDVLNLAHLACGAVGVVSVVGHVAGAHYRAMVEAVDAGDLPTARGINARLLPAVRGIMTRTQGAIMAKAALELQGRLPNRHLRPPMLPASEAEVAALADDLREAGLLGSA
jgi:4-hydroxy-tetrahydrodipicolinate synthase